jgi:hypothetical protein
MISFVYNIIKSKVLVKRLILKYKIDIHSLIEMEVVNKYKTTKNNKNTISKEVVIKLN